MEKKGFEEMITKTDQQSVFLYKGTMTVKIRILMGNENMINWQLDVSKNTIMADHVI